MSAASGALMTASRGTSQNRLILRRAASSMGRSLRTTMASGTIPRLRSSATLCWVGLVFISSLGPMKGARVTWIEAELPGPTSLRNWRTASRNGRISMSPTVPPTSVMITSASVRSASRRMRCLISFVMCGITWTVPPRKSPRRSFWMTARYTEPVVTLESRRRLVPVNRS